MSKSTAKPTMHQARQELFAATPPEVWRGYFDDGYMWAEAVNEELSYAETIATPGKRI